MLWEPRKRLLFLRGDMMAGEGCQGGWQMILAARFAHIPTPPLTLPRDCWGGQRGAMEIWKTASPGYGWHCGLAVQGTGESAAYADICPALGTGGVWLGKEGIMRGLGVSARLWILGLLRVWGGIGHGPPLPRSSQGSDRGIRWGLGQRWATVGGGSAAAAPIWAGSRLRA